ncbi:serine/threonine-protein kinase [Gimesia panareensis]|uniref:serine/threonine-protein kinase n=1 Tax=Gimesia panareensis TaxID=2527978 RepID=UPI00118CB702|nr:serine/threonine-protein kinase [Gimesia panareensis]QDU49628.1 Serine/threonine-protein kinase PknD [Gimesia panareensis]
MDSNRNLLFGILALQMNFISREQLVAATSVWMVDKSQQLEDILLEQAALSEADRQLLAPLVARHIENHDGNPEKSLAAISSIAPAVSEELKSLGDAQIEASLAIVARDRGDERFTETHISGVPPFVSTVSFARPSAGESRFRILRPHAKGGLGEVSVAEDTELGREVALKEIQSQFADDDISRLRFVLEAEVTGGLEHPGIVPIYGLGQYDDGRPYYAMRFIRGDSLKEAADRFHGLSPKGAAKDQTLDFESIEFRKLLGRFVDVCNAIEYAHSRGVLHRDLKPGNIMLGKYGETLVVDWGLAKVKGRDDATRTEGETTLTPRSGSGSAPTQMGSAIGTPAFMPPEQAAGRLDALGPASDVYSLGATLYYLLTGQPPVTGENLGEVLKRVEAGEFAAPRNVKRDIPKPLEAICLKAMARSPQERYVSPQALADDLERYLADERVSAFSEPLLIRTRRWIRKHPGGVSALAATVLVGLISSILVSTVVSGKNRELGAANTALTESEKVARHAQQDAESARDEARTAQSLTEQALKSAESQKRFARRSLYSSTMVAAQNSIWTPEGYARGKELLAEVRPQLGETDMRGWEWHYLNSLPDPRGRVIHDSGTPVYALSCSPDGKHLAIAGTGAVQIVEFDSGAVVRMLATHENIRVWSLSWSPSGSHIAAVYNKSLQIWNVETGAEQSHLTGHTGKVRDLDWSPDGRRIVTASRDKSIRTWNVETGESLLTIAAHNASVNCVDWSTDGSRLVSGSDDKTIGVWDANTGKSLVTVQGISTEVQCVHFSPDDQRIASSSGGDSDNAVMVWDAMTGENLNTLEDSVAYVTWVEWSPDGSKLLTCQFRRGGRFTGLSADVWDSSTGTHIRRFLGHESAIYGCGWLPDGQHCVTASFDGTVRGWELEIEKREPDLTGHEQRVRTLAWSPDGTRIATASFDKTCKIWDLFSKQEILTFTGHEDQVYCVDWHPDGSRLASCGSERIFHIWNAEDGNVLHTVEATNTGEINQIAWSPDGTLIATAADDKTVRVFRASTGTEVNRFELKDYALAIAWSDDGGRIAAVAAGEASVWNVDDSFLVGQFSLPGCKLWGIRFSPDGTRIAVGGEQSTQDTFGESVQASGGVLAVWDVENQQMIHQFSGHANVVRSVDWSRDGMRVLSSDSDGKVMLWDADTGAQLLVFHDPDERAVVSAAFSPDELLIATAGDAPGIRLWDTRPSLQKELSPRVLSQLDQRIETAPTASDFMSRGQIQARLGLWDKASADFAKATESVEQTEPAASYFETSWWVAGPYPEPLLEPQPPEQSLDPFQPIPNTEDGPADAGTWLPEMLTDNDGLNLGRIFSGAEHVSAYAMTRIFTTEAQTIGLLFGADDRIQIWLNGEVVYSRVESRAAVHDDAAIELMLSSGWNTLLIKVSNVTGPHGLFARFSADSLELAQVFDRNEQWDLALKYWDLALKLRSNDQSVLLHHGRAALLIGDRETAC